MKRQIRTSVFETNSSSVNSLTICTKDEWDKWENGELVFNRWLRKLDKPGMVDEADAVYSPEEFFDDVQDECYETFKENYVTPGGEEIIAFGYYGHD